MKPKEIVVLMVESGKETTAGLWADGSIVASGLIFPFTEHTKTTHTVQITISVPCGCCCIHIFSQFSPGSLMGSAIQPIK